MILNAKNNQFVFYFGPNFWCDEVKTKYAEFYKSLLLPYDNIEDYMMSTLQSINFPGIKIDPVKQIGTYGRERNYKGSEQIKDTMEKKCTLTFRLSEGFMNYIIFYNNFVRFLDFKNKAQNDEMYTLGVLNNEGFLVSTLKFYYPYITGISDLSLDYTSADNTMNKFTVSFVYNDWDIFFNYNEMINLYTMS